MSFIHFKIIMRYASDKFIFVYWNQRVTWTFSICLFQRSYLDGLLLEEKFKFWQRTKSYEEWITDVVVLISSSYAHF